MDERFRMADGSMLTVHSQHYCKPPCAFHDPLPGPWEDWPLAYETTVYSDNDSIVLRVCKHEIRHPAVEQFPHWMESDTVTLARHRCCGCPCAPDGVLGSNLRLLIPASELRAMEADELAVDALDPGPKDLSPFVKVGTQVDQVGTEEDPNKVAADYLETIRPHLDGMLHRALFLMMIAHPILGVGIRGKAPYGFEIECDNGCSDYFNQHDIRTDDNRCVTLKLAILGGYVPVEWDIENDDEDDD